MIDYKIPDEYPPGVVTIHKLDDLDIWFMDRPHWGMRSIIGYTGTPYVAIYRHYWSSKCRISAFLSYPNGMGEDDRFFWEIYCLNGDLFEDIERFHYEEEMISRLVELLEVK